MGTSLGGQDIENSGSLGLNTSYTVSGLPTDGSQVYVIWLYFDMPVSEASDHDLVGAMETSGQQRPDVVFSSI